MSLLYPLGLIEINAPALPEMTGPEPTASAACRASVSEVRILNLLSESKILSHLLPNRPSDQLSRRTPRRTLVYEMSATAAQAARLHRGEPTQSEIWTQSEKESPGEPSEPSA